MYTKRERVSRAITIKLQSHKLLEDMKNFAYRTLDHIVYSTIRKASFNPVSVPFCFSSARAMRTAKVPQFCADMQIVPTFGRVSHVACKRYIALPKAIGRKNYERVALSSTARSGFFFFSPPRSRRPRRSLAEVQRTSGRARGRWSIADRAERGVEVGR